MDGRRQPNRHGRGRPDPRPRGRRVSFAAPADDATTGEASRGHGAALVTHPGDEAAPRGSSGVRVASLRPSAFVWTWPGVGRGQRDCRGRCAPATPPRKARHQAARGLPGHQGPGGRFSPLPGVPPAARARLARRYAPGPGRPAATEGEGATPSCPDANGCGTPTGMPPCPPVPADEGGCAHGKPLRRPGRRGRTPPTPPPPEGRGGTTGRVPSPPP